jgi:hypothetical protein
MGTVRAFAVWSITAALVMVAPPGAVADDADTARIEFESILQGLNDNSFDRFSRATDEKTLTSRIFDGRMVGADVKSAFTQDFDGSIERMFTSSFPESKSDILATIVDFQVRGNEGRAVVRYEASGYRYSYHVYEFGLDAKGRIAIVDWIDYYQGDRFSTEAGLALVMAMPSKPATRNLLDNKTISDRDAFQVGELFKAVRDQNGARFFQIYDDLDETLHREKVIARLNLQVALQARDKARTESALQNLLQAFPDDALQSLRLVEFYIPMRRYQDAVDALVLLEEDLGITDGALGTLKAMAALADGNAADAETFAKQATEAEPTLEVAWWSLLRARTAAEDYAGATEAMTRLEDDFGLTLNSQKLARDRFLKVLADKPEYLAWRSSRD